MWGLDPCSTVFCFRARQSSRCSRPGCAESGMHWGGCDRGGDDTNVLRSYPRAIWFLGVHGAIGPRLRHGTIAFTLDLRTSKSCPHL